MIALFTKKSLRKTAQGLVSALLKKALPDTLYFWPKRERAYVALVSLFCVLLVLTNIIGLKVFQAPSLPLVGALPLTSGILVYPFTFVLSDTITEIYGQKRANFMVYLGFLFSILMYGFVKIVLSLPLYSYADSLDAHPVESYHHAFSTVFSLSGVMVFASLAAYLSAQLVDVALFQKIKKHTQGKHLWLRNNLSTMAAQLIDTAIVSSIVLFLGLHMQRKEGLELIGAIYLYKFILSILSTPFTYLLTGFLKRLP